MNYSELLAFIVPETLLVLAALGALLIDLTTMRGRPLNERMKWAMGLSCLGCGVAAAACFLGAETTPTGYLDGMFVFNPLTRLVKIVILLLTAITAILSVDSKFTEHVGEYFALLLLATVGMMFLVSSENILLIFISLELLSLCLYVMTAFNKQNIQSAEAALKYFLFGGMAAAFLLFGLSLVYGLSGEINLTKIAAKIAGPKLDPLLVLALLMVVIGFGFKVAAVPFHLWAPDTYQGAPLPSAAFIASGSKVASFFILAKVMIVGFAGAEGSGAWRGYLQGWMPVLALVAALSVVLGNLAAIAQTSVRRLLAYSAIAQAGYILIGLLANQRADGLASVLYYVTTYALTTLGAFGVVAVVQERTGDDKLSAFAGLSRRAPLVSFCMMIFLLSLAGIPPLAGFFGKFFLFKSALFIQGAAQPLGLLWLVILALAMSAVSLYYYLQVLKQIYVIEAPTGAESAKVTPLARTILLLLALAIVILGSAPNLLLEPLTSAIKAAGF
ncbi:MAG: NADH-quinone oxidoreductase subunit N [Verrucomicrobia bacterium]|nr:NADH-quinone oxidoreductase subunit N [Verrucomicrobiota bacterium]